MRFSAITCEIVGYRSDIHRKNFGTPILGAWVVVVEVEVVLLGVSEW